MGHGGTHSAIVLVPFFFILNAHLDTLFQGREEYKWKEVKYVIAAVQCSDHSTKGLLS